MGVVTRWIFHKIQIGHPSESAALFYNQRMSTLSEKTKKALAEAEGNEKELKWIQTSIAKGYEGVGVIFTCDNNYVLGINKKREAEYPGGKVELEDASIVDTVKREVQEETGLSLDPARFETKYQVTGGTTGYPSWVYIVNLTEEEFQKLTSTDGTFSKFIKVKTIKNVDQVVDVLTGEAYEIRKFNKKYVLPQIAEYLN